MRLRVRKAKIPKAERDVCEHFGEAVIAQMLASGLVPRAKDLHAIYQSDLAVEHARDWLRESHDLNERRASVDLLLELVIIALILGEIVLGIQGLVETRRLGTAEFSQMQEVTQSLESAKEGLDSSVAVAAKQLSLMQGMVDPALEISIGDIFKPERANEITIKNTGPQSVRGLSVNLRCFVFKNNYDRNPILLFQGLPTGDETKRRWWFTSEVHSGETIRKDTSEALNNFLSNAEITIGREPGPAPSMDELSHPLPLASHELLAIDFTYYRVADNKKYEESRTAWLARNSKTHNAATVTSMPVSTELQVFLSRMP